MAHDHERRPEPDVSVAAGTPLFGLTDLTRVYLKAYLPEPMLGLVRLGQPAQIWVDAFADRPFDARLGYIASRAEFTPKEVQTRDERTKLVFEVRLYPTADAGGQLLPGQPAAPRLSQPRARSQCFLAACPTFASRPPPSAFRPPLSRAASRP